MIMDGTKNNNNDKKANQAWRKKPRKFAPKSRLGCKTCKIRRIKCDLAQPSCLKCKSTGRTCDGYGETQLTSKIDIDIESSHCPNRENGNGAESYDNHYPCTTISTYQTKQWHAKHYNPFLQNPGPFMILPVTGSAQTEAMCFFEYISIKHLNEYHPSESWRQTLMYFSQTVPAVRYAAIALSLAHQNYLDRGSSNSNYVKDWSPDKTPLVYYNRAIQLLLSQEASDSTETTAITLLVCYLFTCFDHISGNYVQALKHLRGGVELSRNISKTLPNSARTYDDDDGARLSGGVRSLTSQVTKQIRRLDMQAVTFLVDWTPTGFQEEMFSSTSKFPLAVNNSAGVGVFPSLDQAAEHLHVLVAQVMRLRNTEQSLSPLGAMPALPSSLKDVVLGKLEAWLTVFENTLFHLRRDPLSSLFSSSSPSSSSFHDTDKDADTETTRLISLLRLQHLIAWTFLRSYGSAGEMDYDAYLPQFRACVALAGAVAAAHERYSGSLGATFTPEIGIVPVLYIVGAKCRDPAVRRDVVRILRRQPVREAVWDSISAARVVERIVEIEECEDEDGERRERVQSMEQITMCQRVEGMSWVQSPGRLDIKYTFCAREGVHAETLMF